MVFFSMNKEYTQILQTKETRRKPWLVLVDGDEYEEFENLKSVKGKFFGLFLMNKQFTKILQTPETRRRPLLVWALKILKASEFEVTTDEDTDEILILA